MLVLGWSWCRVVARAELDRASSVPVGPQPSLSRSATARGRLLVLTFDLGPTPSRVIVPLAVSVQRLAREG